MSDCQHEYSYKGPHVEGRESHTTSVSMKTLYDVFFCKKCLKEEKKVISSGFHVKVPQNATTSGYGFN